MGFVINLILFIVFWFVGNILCSFGVIAPLIVIRTALPITKHLYKQGLVYELGLKKAKQQSAFTIFFWFIIDIVAIALLCMYGNIYVCFGFSFGFTFSFFPGIGRTGPITDNIADYLKSYSECFPPENNEEIIKELYIYQHLGH